MSMNSCDFVGNLANEPMYFEDETASRILFTLAVDNNGKTKDGQKTAEFLDFVAWRETADFVHNYCHKGDVLSVHSHAKSHQYTNKNGDKVSKVEFQTSSVDLVCRSKINAEIYGNKSS